VKTIGSITFTTDDEAKKHVRFLLEELGEGTAVRPEHPQFAFLAALLGRHKDAAGKVGIGIEAFNVIRNTKGAFALDLIRVDGTYVSFSWLECITPKVHPTSKYLGEAMRTACKSESLRFFEAHYHQGWTCRCGWVSDTTAGVDVDHVVPFSMLKTAFLANEKAHPEVFLHDGHRPAAFLLSDKAFSDRWVAFHQANSRYQLLCSRCNSSKGAKVAA
jgi:hypothetical protein